MLLLTGSSRYTQFTQLTLKCKHRDAHADWMEYIPTSASDWLRHCGDGFPFVVGCSSKRKWIEEKVINLFGSLD